jgi:hypothetical protein
MCEHMGAVPMVMQRSMVHVSMSSQLKGELRTHRSRAGSQLHVPEHGSPCSRAQVESPSSHGSSATHPPLAAETSLGTQKRPEGQRMSLGACTHRPAVASQRSSVQAT